MEIGEIGVSEIGVSEIGVRVEIIGALGQVFLTSKIFHSQTLYSYLLHFSGHHAMNLFA